MRGLVPSIPRIWSRVEECSREWSKSSLSPTGVLTTITTRKPDPCPEGGCSHARQEPFKHRRDRAMIHSDHRSAFGFESFVLRTRARRIPPHIESFLTGAGMRADWADSTPPFNLQAMRSSTFISAWMRTGPVRAEWVGRDAANSRILFVFAGAGSVGIRHGSETATVSVGGVVAPSPAQGGPPTTLEALAGANEVTLFSLTTSSVGGPVHLPRAINAVDDRAIIAFAFGAAHGLAHAGLPGSSSGASMAQGSASSIGRALLSQWAAATPALSDVYETTMHFIRVHAGDPSLTAVRIAAAVGVSTRSLQALFQRHETTVVRELRRERFENAINLLSVEPDMPRSLVAARSGFRTVKQLRQAYLEFSMSASGA